MSASGPSGAVEKPAVEDLGTADSSTAFRRPASGRPDSARNDNESADGNVVRESLDPNHWQPLAYVNATGDLVTQRFVGAQWSAVTPFALTSGDQFRYLVRLIGPAAEAWTKAQRLFGTGNSKQTAMRLQ
jgi:hypothetical protein